MFSRHRSSHHGGLTIGTQRLSVLVDHWLIPRPQAVHDAHLVLRLSREAGDLLTLYDRLPGIIENVGKDCRTVASITLGIRDGCCGAHMDWRSRLTRQKRCLHASTPSQRSPAAALREGSRSGPHVQQTRRTRRTAN